MVRVIRVIPGATPENPNAIPGRGTAPRGTDVVSTSNDQATGARQDPLIKVDG